MLKTSFELAGLFWTYTIYKKSSNTGILELVVNVSPLYGNNVSSGYSMYVLNCFFLVLYLILQGWLPPGGAVEKVNVVFCHSLPTHTSKASRIPIPAPPPIQSSAQVCSVDGTSSDIFFPHLTPGFQFW